ncbi:hypothetical protein COCMIDRAFT_23127 [Bipolaris oryzae ATCC 44560]|uniref:Uncharacterized protein n=1 Tax=Bipolaris oryzae ATCC 44560 TaxID=930090 RepID=W6ZNM9_COCMI|nr:uncharacterized protein COCMIDRAFT_23127 [Bipolaris oryzae ATCC 44560]EUC49144.1 hypothetical protein COCMIDRAFT_23127 [Bipolaris oryzae ATCC 44560]
MPYAKKRDQKNDPFWAHGGWGAVETAIGSSDNKVSMMVNPLPLFPKSSIYPDFMIEPATAAAARAYTIIKREMQLTDNEANLGTPQDTGFSIFVCLAVSRHSTEKERSEHLKIILDGLRWRFQGQERFVLVRQEMVKHRLWSMECVMRRTSLDTAGGDVFLAISSALERFEYVQDLINNNEGSERVPEDCLRGSFEGPTYWLATLIARCGTNNILKVVDWLETSQYFGPMSEDGPLDDVKDVDYVGYVDGVAALFGSSDISQYFGFMSQEDPIDDADDIDDIKTKGTDESKYINCPKGEFSTLTNHRVGFILPYGQSIRAWATLTAKRYEDVLNSYTDMCGADSWEMDPRFAAILQEFSQSLPHEYETVLETSREDM